MEDRDRSKLFLIMGSQMRLFESLYYQNRDGRLDDWMWKSAQWPFLFMMKNPCFGSYWSVHGKGFTQDFQTFIKDLATSDLVRDFPDYPYPQFPRDTKENAPAKESSLDEHPSLED